MSSVQLDGSQSPAKTKGEQIGYQGCKKSRTTNLLFLCDRQGQVLAWSEAQEGQHHESHQIGSVFTGLLAELEQVGLATAGLFLNADAGFDTAELRICCYEADSEANSAINPRGGRVEEAYFDPLLYQHRTAIERATAWLDSCRTLLIRFEAKAQHWLCWHWLAVSVQFLRRINRKQKP